MNGETEKNRKLERDLERKFWSVIGQKIKIYTVKVCRIVTGTVLPRYNTVSGSLPKTIPCVLQLQHSAPIRSVNTVQFQNKIDHPSNFYQNCVRDGAFITFCCLKFCTSIIYPCCMWPAGEMTVEMVHNCRFPRSSWRYIKFDRNIDLICPSTVYRPGNSTRKYIFGSTFSF